MNLSNLENMIELTTPMECAHSESIDIHQTMINEWICEISYCNLNPPTRSKKDLLTRPKPFMSKPVCKPI